MYSQDEDESRKWSVWLPIPSVIRDVFPMVCIRSRLEYEILRTAEPMPMRKETFVILMLICLRIRDTERRETGERPSHSDASPRLAGGFSLGRSFRFNDILFFDHGLTVFDAEPVGKLVFLGMGAGARELGCCCR